jgi:hypothetical protein
LKGRKIITQNGKITLLWKDEWLMDKPICMVAPVLYDWCTQKDITVNQFLTLNGQIGFDRWLPPPLFEQWMDIVNQVYNFEFKDENDLIKWKWSGKGIYTTKSVYDQLTSGDSGKHFQYIWKAKLPYKIKIFTWLMENNAILTKDNMVKRKWEGNPICVFCDQPETLEHLIFQCIVAKCVWGMVGICMGATNIPSNIINYKEWIQNILPQGKEVHHFGFAAISWAIWKSRNKIVFEKKIIKHPAEIIMHACAFMFYWAGLFKPDFAGGVAEGDKVLLMMAYKILAQQRRALVVGCSRHQEMTKWETWMRHDRRQPSESDDSFTADVDGSWNCLEDGFC